MQEITDPAEGNHRPAEHRQIGVERDQLSNRHLTGDDPPAAQPQHEQRADAHQESHAREIESLKTNERPVAVDVLLVRGAKPRDLERLLSVRAHDAHARQRLLGDGADVRELLLNLLEACMNRDARST